MQQRMSIKAIPQLEEEKTSSNQWEDDSLLQGGIGPGYHCQNLQ